MSESSTGHSGQKSLDGSSKTGRVARGTRTEDRNGQKQTKLGQWGEVTRYRVTAGQKSAKEPGKKAGDGASLSGDSQFADHERRLTELQKNQTEIKKGQEEILKLLNRMTVGQRVGVTAEERRQRPIHHPSFNPPPLQRRQPEHTDRAPQRRADELNEPSMNQLFYMMHEDQVQSRYMQASALLKPLKGTEGRTHLEDYFRELELITDGWSSRRRANLLATHLEGRARLAYNILSATDRQDYELVKDSVLNGGAQAISLRSKAKNELMNGMRQAQGESLQDFGQRILSTVRDSMLPDTPEHTIEDVASGHLLRCIGDPSIQSMLTLHQHHYSYLQLLDQAVTMKEVKDVSAGPQPDRTRQPQTEIYQQRRPQNHWLNSQVPQRYPPASRQMVDERRNQATGLNPRMGANAVDAEDLTDGMIRVIMGDTKAETKQGSPPYCPAVFTQTPREVMALSAQEQKSQCTTASSTAKEPVPRRNKARVGAGKAPTSPTKFPHKRYDSSHVAFLSQHVDESGVFNGRHFQREVARDMQALGAAVLNADFAPSVTEVLITLPKATGGRYGETLKSIINHIGKFPHVRVYIVPPPPVKTAQYEAAIDQLTDVFRTSQPANIVRLEHRLKSFYTVGWASAIGGATTKFHVRDGQWTLEGVHAIRSFLLHAMQMSWPFDQSPESPNKRPHTVVRDERPAEPKPHEASRVRVIKASIPRSSNGQNSMSGDWIHRDRPTGPRTSEHESTSHASQVYHGPRVFYSSRLMAVRGEVRLKAPSPLIHTTGMRRDAVGLPFPLTSTASFDYAAQMNGS